MEVFEVVEPSVDDGVEVFLVGFPCLYFIQLIAGQISFFDELRLLYLYHSVLEELVIIFKFIGYLVTAIVVHQVDQVILLQLYWHLFAHLL